MANLARVVRKQKMSARADAKRADGTYNQIKFAVKPKDKYKTRQNNICSMCGRPRGFLRDFGICRCCFREMVEKCEVPGVKKSSW